jgi:hypothetical protein
MTKNKLLGILRDKEKLIEALHALDKTTPVFNTADTYVQTENTESGYQPEFNHLKRGPP